MVLCLTGVGALPGRGVRSVRGLKWELMDHVQIASRVQDLEVAPALLVLYRDAFHPNDAVALAAAEKWRVDQ